MQHARRQSELPAKPAIPRLFTVPGGGPSECDFEHHAARTEGIFAAHKSGWPGQKRSDYQWERALDISIEKPGFLMKDKHSIGKLFATVMIHRGIND